MGAAKGVRLEAGLCEEAWESCRQSTAGRRKKDRGGRMCVFTMRLGVMQGKRMLGWFSSYLEEGTGAGLGAG